MFSVKKVFQFFSIEIIKSVYSMKYRKTRRKRKKRMTKKTGGNIPITFEDIMQSIVETKSEYCGYIESDQHFLTHIGEPKETPEQRGSCNQPIRSTVWHTHTTQSKYYPSMEDIYKVFKYEAIRESFIYTVFGYWVLTYSGEAVKLPEDVIASINELLGDFYKGTERGRAYNIDMIMELTSQLNTQLPGFNIRWSEFGE
jgi:hypothetical protein